MSPAPPTITTLTTYAGLLAAAGHAAVVRQEVHPRLIAPALACGSAVLFAREDQSGTIGAVALGSALDVAALLSSSWRDVAGYEPVRNLTVERVNHDLLVAAGARGIGLWATMTVEPGGLERRPLAMGWSLDDEVGRAEAMAFVAEHYSTRWLPPAPLRERWVGVRNPAGALLATGMSADTPAGLTRLSSITVPVSARGNGLGRAVTQALVELAFARGETEVALGVDDDNAIARVLYSRMGFRLTHKFSSGILSRQPGAAIDARDS